MSQYKQFGVQQTSPEQGFPKLSSTAVEFTCAVFYSEASEIASIYLSYLRLVFSKL